MRLLQLLILFVLFTVSCQNKMTDKTVQKHRDDTTKENKSNASVYEAKSESSSGDFLNFWQNFRTAVLNSDTTQIMEQTQFPFQTRGPLDNDPTIEYSKKKFARVFAAFLNQWNGLDLNGGTELDLIKKTEIPNKDDVQNNYVRIGDLVFDKSHKTWRLVLVYLNDDTIESLKK